MKKFNKYSFKLAGFSLLETLVVMVLITVGLLAVLTLTVETLKSQQVNRNQLIARYLAQEGLELIKNVRDSNFKERMSGNAVPWNQSFYTGGPPSCVFYTTQYNVFAPAYLATRSSSTPFTPDEYGVLGTATTSSSTDFFVHATGTPATIFSRGISVCPDNNDLSSFTVVSSVTWYEKGDQYYYDLQTVLYDWK